MGDRVPVSFVVSELLAALDPDGAYTDSTAHILVWKVDVDERPLVVDRVILWVHHRPAQGKPSWLLANLYRHPLDAPTNNERWYVAEVADAPYTGRRAYASPPTSAELDAFLKDSWWEFRATQGFWLLDQGVCKNAWRAAIGRDPNHAF
jgi:hypothetical protein